jgi:hypothetical protein
MTGLPMPVDMEMERSPGVPCSVSPREAPWAVRSALPPTTVTGRVLRSAAVATGLADTWMVGSGAGRAESAGGGWRFTVSATWAARAVGTAARAPTARAPTARAPGGRAPRMKVPIGAAPKMREARRRVFDLAMLNN